MKAMPDVKTRAVMFQHINDNHRVTVEPADYKFSASGRVIGETKGRAIQFERHVYRTEDPEEITLLRRRLDPQDELYDPRMIEVEQVAPDPSQILAELATASADRTREIQAEELEGWERPVVLETCERKLASMGGRPRKET